LAVLRKDKTVSLPRRTFQVKRFVSARGAMPADTRLKSLAALGKAVEPATGGRRRHCAELAHYASQSASAASCATDTSVHPSTSVREWGMALAFYHHRFVTQRKWRALMGRIGRTYPRPYAGEMPIVRGRVLFLSPTEAIRHHLQRAEPLAWLFLIVALFGASVAIGL
jgi:hypothetical protein